ncbi:MAG: arginine repressor [Clostridia bacterium]|nr:arginine repressor [Clostridia bacterium]
MKGNRQEKILEIITDNIIVTQDELQQVLNKSGYNVTQSTVSRDIKELRLVKGRDIQGNYRYLSPEISNTNNQPIANYKDLFANSVKNVDCAMNNIVIQCYNGMASSVCVAIDNLFEGRMLGSIAGDDTIFIIARNTEEAVKLTFEIKKFI